MMAASCVRQQGARERFAFTVVDVGEGLAQIGKTGVDAIAWDMGDTGAATEWNRVYNELGRPHLDAIAISHSHSDHMGGLNRLGDSVAFSGLIITSIFEDTGLIRQNCGPWQGRISFRTIAEGDTIGGLNGVSVECLWPPRDLAVSVPVIDDDKNRYSLCFMVRYGANAVLITSDIDTFAEQELAARYGFSLGSDVIVVPHHGSSSSVDPVFYGYVNPSAAVISCGIDNPYGHPAQNVLDLLFQMHVQLFETAIKGTVSAVANGYYFAVSPQSITP
ncbi:MAG TPA: MBL fold metallo-hydrolase [Chitinivibrionales bacterium]|nr:MBL fold metallo-hydrolase [Chitinivibrionales bacterium]